ncbi:MAG: hypothetical protein GX456_12365, partial [Verrucomicrobia bacterium]|nr:hypothetical protein [Verrucomicrobiota bacterium]
MTRPAVHETLHKAGQALRAHHKHRVCPHTGPFALAADPDGFYPEAADALGVGRREAFGVRQLAAALFFCPNTVPVPISHIPHQPDARSCDPFSSPKSGHRTQTGWVRRRIAALLPA